MSSCSLRRLEASLYTFSSFILDHAFCPYSELPRPILGSHACRRRSGRHRIWSPSSTLSQDDSFWRSSPLTPLWPWPGRGEREHRIHHKHCPFWDHNSCLRPRDFGLAVVTGIGPITDIINPVSTGGFSHPPNLVGIISSPVCDLITIVNLDLPGCLYIASEEQEMAPLPNMPPR